MNPTKQKEDCCLKGHAAWFQWHKVSFLKKAKLTYGVCSQVINFLWWPLGSEGGQGCCRWYSVSGLCAFFHVWVYSVKSHPMHILDFCTLCVDGDVTHQWKPTLKVKREEAGVRIELCYCYPLPCSCLDTVVWRSNGFQGNDHKDMLIIGS